MIKHIQFVRGTTVQNDKYTGPDGEITIDTDTHTIRIHDGSKAGGYPLNGSDPALAAKVTNLEKTSLTKTEAASTYLGKTSKAESAKTADAVAWTAVSGKPSTFAPASHNQASNTITAMTGYTKPGSTSAIAATDSLNAAIGKIEKALDGKQAAGSYVTTASAFTQAKADGLYLGKTAKAASATVADSATKATQDASGNVITTTYASKSENNSKVAISGNRGQLAGMETPANGTVVNGTSADSMTATGNITVQTGVANTAWTKAVTINNASYTISLGGSWHWVGGKAPEIKVPGILVCHWNSSVGLANYISGAA